MSNFVGCWSNELHLHDAGLSWVWHGYLARNHVTLLTSQWKSGKTTLVSLLLSRLASGGAVAGRALQAGKAVIVSEEAAAQWQLRQHKLDFAGNAYFLCRPFRTLPSPEEWRALINHIAELHAASRFSLVVIDTLASFLPTRSESNATHVMEALLPLQQLTALGLSVLLLHHPRKGDSLPGQAARGSGALAAFVDIIIEMSACGTAGGPPAPAAQEDRRRRLLAFSRFDETPRQLVIELNAAGTDYVTLGDFQDDDFGQNWDRLRLVLEDARDKLTRREILDDWPPDYPKPADTTLLRWLTRAVALSLVAQEGAGRKTDPFRYWLPEKLEEWRQNPIYCLMEQQIKELRLREPPGLAM